jgi:hypothetical protein
MFSPQNVVSDVHRHKQLIHQYSRNASAKKAENGKAHAREDAEYPGVAIAMS